MFNIQLLQHFYLPKHTSKSVSLHCSNSSKLRFYNSPPKWDLHSYKLSAMGIFLAPLLKYKHDFGAVFSRFVLDVTFSYHQKVFALKCPRMKELFLDLTLCRVSLLSGDWNPLHWIWAIGQRIITDSWQAGMFFLIPNIFPLFCFSCQSFITLESIFSLNLKTVFQISKQRGWWVLFQVMSFFVFGSAWSEFGADTHFCTCTYS